MNTTLEQAQIGDWIYHKRLGKHFIKLTYKVNHGLVWYVQGTYKKRLIMEAIPVTSHVTIVKGHLCK